MIGVIVFIIALIFTGSFWSSLNVGIWACAIVGVLTILGYLVHYAISSIYPSPPEDNEEFRAVWDELHKKQDEEHRKKDKDLYL